MLSGLHGRLHAHIDKQAVFLLGFIPKLDVEALKRQGLSAEEITFLQRELIHLCYECLLQPLKAAKAAGMSLPVSIYIIVAFG